MARRAFWCTAFLAVAIGCAYLPKPSPLPSSNTLFVGELVVNSDFPLSSDHRLLSELVAMRGTLTTELGLPPSGEPVYVYLFQTPRSFAAFRRERFPKLEDRRAFFVETDSRLSVYAQWGDRRAEDLRHEVTHGYLHGVIPRLPLWVDEGLAEYFEVPRELHGLNRPHVDLLLANLQRGTWQPDPMRLAKIQAAEKMQQMEYAESWAWIHWLLHSKPENRVLLQQYLAALKDRRNVEPLEDAILVKQPDAPRQLIEHLRWLGSQRAAPVEPGHSGDDGQE